MKKLIKEIRKYIGWYRADTTNRKINGTEDLLQKAAETLTANNDTISAFNERFIKGLPVHSQGLDESDGIECPICKYEVARNDDYAEARPKHCPECGTKLIY